MNTIEKRQSKQKVELLDRLKKTPIVQLACERGGIGRATYYRWKKDDPDFARQADEALAEGASLINDIAESQLISSIKDKNLGAIVFWLRSHHPSYIAKLEVDAKLKMDKESLTNEQEALVKKALKLAGLLTTGKVDEGENHEP